MNPPPQHTNTLLLRSLLIAKRIAMVVSLLCIIPLIVFMLFRTGGWRVHIPDINIFGVHIMILIVLGAMVSSLLHALLRGGVYLVRLYHSKGLEITLPSEDDD